MFDAGETSIIWISQRSMFPLIPVILFLLLQGPSSDRLGRKGQLLGAMEAITSEANLRESDRAALASLLAAEDGHLSRTLWAIFRSDRGTPNPPKLEAPESTPGAIQAPRELGKAPADGFGCGLRVRDGPF